MRRFAIFATAFLGSTALAAAADLFTPPPAEEVVFTAPAPTYFHGPYIGLHGGWGWGHTSADYGDGFEDLNDVCPIDLGPFPGVIPCAASPDPDGAFIGGQAGWNWVFGSGLMLGVEGDYSFSSLNGSQDVGTGIFATDVDLEVDQMASIRARLGWVMGRWMPYVTGGWGWAHAERDAFNALVGGLGGGSLSDSNWHDGWVAGAGLEFAINENWTLNGEYRYFDGGKETYENVVPVDVDLNIHTVRFGVNYNF